MLSEYSTHKIIDYVLRGQVYTPPTTLYLALSTTDPQTTVTEPSGGGYARQTITFGNAASRAVAQDAVVTFPVATADYSGIVGYFAVYDALTGGNMLAHGTFPSGRSIKTGQQVVLESGEISISFNTVGISDYLANAALDWLFNGGSLSQPSTLYVAITSAAIVIGDTGSTLTDFVMTDYARKAATFDAPSDKSTSNSSAVNFGTLTGTGQSIAGIGILDAATGGNLLFFNNDNNDAVASGDTVSYPAGQLSVYLTDYTPLVADGSFTATLSSSVITSTLTDFPVMLNISATSGITNTDMTSIFDELGSNWQKIRVRSGGTRCYVHKAEWDSANEKARLYVRVPSAAGSGTLTVDWGASWPDQTAYIGETGSAAAQSVWSSSVFQGVWLMNEDPSGTAPQILDSTSSGNNGTVSGTVSSSNLVDGLFGKCVNFVNSDSVKVTVPSGCAALDGVDFSFEGMIYLNSDTYSPMFFKGADSYIATMYYSTSFSGTAVFGLKVSAVSAQGSMSTGAWYHLFGTFNASTREEIIYIDGSQANSATSGYDIIGTDNDDLLIGAMDDTSRADGKLANMRIYSNIPSTVWISACNASERDNLITYS